LRWGCIHFLPDVGRGADGAQEPQAEEGIEQESTAPPAPRFHNLLPQVSTTFGFATGLQQLAFAYEDLLSQHLPRDSVLGDYADHGCNLHGERPLCRQSEWVTNVWPVTYYMLQAVEGGGVLFLFIVATMYAGSWCGASAIRISSRFTMRLPYRGWIDTLGKLMALSAAELFSADGGDVLRRSLAGDLAAITTMSSCSTSRSCTL
jgi:hypothetical protein